MEKNIGKIKKVKITIISTFLFFFSTSIIYFLLSKIPLFHSIYYDCFPTFPEAGHDICMVSPLGLIIPFIFGIGVAVYYFYRSLSSIKSD